MTEKASNISGDEKQKKVLGDSSPDKRETLDFEDKKQKKEIASIVSDIFEHEGFREYSKTSGDRLKKYKEEVLDELAVAVFEEGVDKGDIVTFIYEFLKGKKNKPKKVISILLKIIRDIDTKEAEDSSSENDLSGEESGSEDFNLDVAKGMDKKNGTETKKGDKKDKKSVRKDESSHSGDDKLPDHEKVVFSKNKKELRENIEGYKKSLKQILNKLKEKFDKFLEEDLRDNPENAEIRRKFFQTINHYEDEVKDILQSSEYSETLYKKIKKIHSKIGNDLLMEWSADKIKGRKKTDTSVDNSITEPGNETGSEENGTETDIENSHETENKESDAQKKRKDFFIKKYGEKVSYILYSTGHHSFPESSFNLKEFIAGETKSKDRIKIILEDGDNNGKEELWTMKKFIEMIKKGYKKEDNAGGIDDSMELSAEASSDNASINSSDVESGAEKESNLGEISGKEIKDKKEAEFSAEQVEIIEGIYVEIAKRNIGYLESEDFGNAIIELGYDKEDVEELRKIEIKRFWKKTIVDELKSGGEFSGEKMEKAINLVKEKVK